MDIPVVFEDEHFIVINKPPGIVVNRAESVKVPTVQDWAEERIDSKSISVHSEEEKAFVDRAGIVHRIDKETSGCLLIAKTVDAFIKLQAMFKERRIHKTYLALAHGEVKPAEGEIRAPVGRLPWNRERFGIVPGGKDSVTKYERTGLFYHDKEPISVVVLYPETGRTHQIRVHLKYINHPIIGDFQYAGRKTSRNDRVWAPRVMLHAWKIAFTHPITGAQLAIESPIPDDMSTLIG